MTLSLIFRPKRLNRLILQHSLDNSNLNLKELYDFILERTILLKSYDSTNYEDYSYLQEIQHIVNINFLKSIFNVINSSSSFSQVKSISNEFVRKITSELSSKRSKNYNLSKYHRYYLDMINSFYEDPQEYEIIDSLTIPDGSPIGSDNCTNFTIR